MFWFLYTKWSDVLVFQYDFASYLLQGRKNKITRATHFRTVATKRLHQLATTTALDEKHLLNANLWEQSINKERRQDAE